jgi:hypothetical protein
MVHAVSPAGIELVMVTVEGNEVHAGFRTRVRHR